MTYAEIRIVIAAYVGCGVALAYLLLSSFGYIQADGYGIYMPDVASYQISSIYK